MKLLTSLAFVLLLAAGIFAGPPFIDNGSRPIYWSSWTDTYFLAVNGGSDTSMAFEMYPDMAIQMHYLIGDSGQVNVQYSMFADSAWSDSACGTRVILCDSLSAVSKRASWGPIVDISTSCPARYFRIIAIASEGAEDSIAGWSYILRYGK